MSNHGLSRTRIYSVWCGMKQRCLNKNAKHFNRYGGRGITICDEWVNSFSNFFNDMGHPPKNYTIERINNNLGYSKENCRWATRSEQQRNRECNKFVSFNGETKTAIEWSNELNIARQTIYDRITNGWSAEKILKKEKQINKSGLALGGKANGERQRSKTHCKNGHEFSFANTLVDKNGNRSCRRCHADRQRARNHAKKVI